MDGWRDRIAGYEWNSGDGQTGSGEQATHAFAATGTYTVSLTVSDENGQRDKAEHPVQVQE